MKQIKALHHYLSSLPYIAKDDLESWAQNGSFDYSGQQISTLDQSFKVTDLEYLAVFSIEGFTGDGTQLFIDLIMWLKNNNYDFETHGKPEWDISPIDKNSADVEFSVWFIQPIFAILDDEKGYKEVVPDIATAEELVSVEHELRCKQ